MREQVITIPVVALKGLTILPDMVLHFGINRPKSVVTVERTMVGDQKLLLVAQRHPEIVEPEQGDLFQVGTVEVVKRLVKLLGKVTRVLVEGLERAELLCPEAEEPVMMGEITVIGAEEDDLDSLTQEAMLHILRDRLEEYGRVNSKIMKEILSDLPIITDLNETLDQIVIQLPWDYVIHQAVLESSSLSAGYEVMMHTLLTEMEVYRIKKDFQEKIKADVGQSQKEYILREQMKIIRRELREDAVSDANEYQKKLDALRADREVKEKLHKEIERFRNMPVESQKANVLRTYAETPLDLPQKKISKDNNDIKHAERVLNEDHYELERVKERILEYPAIRALTKKGADLIICLVGPPGTGKASIARSVARVLNGRRVHISLEGVRDEAEIRGHRKTHVDAMPGRIAGGMRQASMSNPLILLDEIDEINSDYKGNTSSTLLEVLDGEQNVKFRGHHVELPIDLSQVPSTATANTTQTISGPLLDRVRLVEVNSYTENEKSHIARGCLVSGQMEHNGLRGSQITLPDRSLEKIIHNYTREAGVRNLERRIGDVCHKAARQFLENRKRSIKISESNLEKYLGKEKVTSENADEEDEIGIVRGLAWTSAGGGILQVKVNMVLGKGSLLMTGRLGDVMKESAQTTLTYVRSVCPEYGTIDDHFEEHDPRIRIPGGVVPKDEPSVGITMATVILSAATGKSVQAKVAMTGKVTLRRRVLPVGGLKEKILAAEVAHIEKVLVPDRSQLDMAELSREVTKGLDIVYVKAMEDVASEALVQSADRNQGKQI